MPLDAMTIAGLQKELCTLTVGAKIDKVQQPAKDMLILSLRGNGQNLKLLISAGVGTARVHITKESYENPQSPPMFCMLLRKHLCGARITGIEQPDMERMLVFSLDAFDEMGIEVKKQLVVEMMGRSSNIILVGPEGHVVDCLRRVDGDMSRTRLVMPGMLYRLPPKQEKTGFFEVSDNELQEIFKSSKDEKPADKWLLDSFSGLSPLIAREMVFRSTGDCSVCMSDINDSMKNALILEVLKLRRKVETGDFEPTMLSREDKPTDFSFMPILQYENAGESRKYSDFSTLLEEYYTRRDKQEQMRRKSQSLAKAVKSAHERSIRKLAARQQELLKTGERELNRKRGDLITANLFRMKKGDRSIEVDDYYEEGCPKLSIPLDPLKSPQQNAAAYYKEYNKAKTAEKYLGDLISKGESEEEYLADVLDAVSRCESERDLAEIRRELTQMGYLRQQKSAKKEKIKEGEPMRFCSSAGMEILVGKNNSQNDKLTTKLARRTDVWLHVQKLHGSHVIISCDGTRPDDKTLLEAASLAAYYSEARESGKVPVDYTQVRFVKKPSGALPGKVIYTDYSTLMTQPDEVLAEKLRTK